MQAKIIEMVNFIRKAGLNVSPGEALDFARALQMTCLHPDDALTSALCTMAKDKYSYVNLSIIFANYLQQHDNNQPNTIIPPVLNVQTVLENPPKLNKTVFMSKIEKIKDTIRIEVMKSKSVDSTGGMALGGTGNNSTGNKPSKSSSQTSSNNQVSNKSKHLKPDNVYYNVMPTNLRDKDIANADKDQLEEIKKIIIGIGRRLAVSRGYRKKPASTGSIDLRRTIKQAIPYGGIPLVVKREQRVPAKPRIVILCDLSGSVAPYSQFFLQLLISMQSKFTSIKSFAFVDRIQEITAMARSQSNSWNVTAQKILRESKISLTGFSNYGLVWEYFYKDQAHVLKPQTTLIILGDAKNNWQPDGIEYFDSITRQYARTIWLNPLPQEKWQQDDCIMELYSPFCSKVFECRSANQLAKVIKNIL